MQIATICSRLRAAVCWNYTLVFTLSIGYCSRLRAAVCWNPFFRPYKNKGSKQPPPRGCVLKLPLTCQKSLLYARSRLRAAVCWNAITGSIKIFADAAASARLCVETDCWALGYRAERQPPPRGCVLKHQSVYFHQGVYLAAASARLCVETARTTQHYIRKESSRLRAAVCWNIITSNVVKMLFAAASARLCVETSTLIHPLIGLSRSRLRAAVCWNKWNPQKTQKKLKT